MNQKKLLTVDHRDDLKKIQNGYWFNQGNPGDMNANKYGTRKVNINKKIFL